MMVDDRLKYGTDLVKEGVVFLKRGKSRWMSLSKGNHYGGGSSEFFFVL